MEWIPLAVAVGIVSVCVALIVRELLAIILACVVSRAIRQAIQQQERHDRAVFRNTAATIYFANATSNEFRRLRGDGT